MLGGKFTDVCQTNKESISSVFFLLSSKATKLKNPYKNESTLKPQLNMNSFPCAKSKSEAQIHQSRDRSENSIYFVLFACSNVVHFDTLLAFCLFWNSCLCLCLCLKSCTFVVYIFNFLLLSAFPVSYSKAFLCCFCILFRKILTKPTLTNWQRNELRLLTKRKKAFCFWKKKKNLHALQLRPQLHIKTVIPERDSCNLCRRIARA